MAISRLDGRIPTINRSEAYEEFFEDRGVNFIRQHSMPNLRQPTAKELSQLEMRTHTWQINDQYSVIANKYYGDPKLWFVIAWINHKPTEGYLTVGDVLYIPMPLERILELINL